MSLTKIDGKFVLNIPINKLAVVGSRSFNSFNILEYYINELRKEYPDINLIISGGALGADKLGEHYAEKYNIDIQIYKPDWKTHGKVAALYRNTDIISKSDIVIAFWDGKSKGTLDSINKAQNYGKIMWIVRI
jgi:hypothetical protein